MPEEFDVTDLNDHPLPKKSELLRATGIAAVVAIVILVTTILPAEYGLDPTGLGSSLGLDQLNVETTETDVAVSDNQLLANSITALTRASTNLRQDSLTIVIPAYEGIELKADMKPGQSLAFDWQTDGEPLYTDMHGEPPNADTNEFTSYWKEKQQSAGQGTLVAQFEGTHGWYWQNMSEEDITVTIDVSGFYQDIFQKQ
jgi:hypothetical protein